MYGIKFDEIASKTDMCEWLHDIGWRAPCDAQWEKIGSLWDEIANLQAENEQLRATLKIANAWLGDDAAFFDTDDFRQAKRSIEEALKA